MDLKNITKTIYRISLLLTLISTAFLLTSFALSFDMVNGYFVSGALPTLFIIFFALGFVIPLVSIIMLHKLGTIKTDNNIDNQKTIYLILAGTLILSSFIFSILAQSKNFTISIIGIFAFATFVLLCTIKSGYAYSHIKLACLLFSALFPLIMTIDNNSVMIRHSNSVENMLSSIFGISFLLYILYEGKRLFTEEHSKFHFASMLLAAHTGFSLSISYIAVYLMGIANETTRFYQMVLIFLISTFVEIEILRFVKHSTCDKQNNTKTDD